MAITSTGSYQSWAIAFTPIHTFAISVAVYRLVYRYKIRKLWWDDLAIFWALIFDMMFFSLFWAREQLNNVNHPVHTRLVLYWISSMSYFPLMWLSRMSMVLSLARMLPPDSKKRRIPWILAGIFFLLGIVLALQTVIVCTKDQSWHHTASAQCTGISWISSFVCDIIADVLLIVLPVFFLYRVKFPASQRRLVFTVFASSIIVCFMTIILYTFLLGPAAWGPNRFKIVIYISQLQGVVQFIVANMLIIVVTIYRWLRGGKEAETGAGDATDYFATTMAQAETTMTREVSATPPSGSVEKL